MVDIDNPERFELMPLGPGGRAEDGDPWSDWWDNRHELMRMCPPGRTFRPFEVAPCGSCSASGVCEVCHGAAEILNDEDQLIPCSLCRGTGDCWECDGDGQSVFTTKIKES